METTMRASETEKNTIGDGSHNGATKYRNMPSFSFGTEDRFAY